MSELLEIKHLCVSIASPYGKVEAVRDVSLTLRRGEILAIVGESGCGKSMLCKSIMKLLPASASIDGGSICVNGADITHYTERDMTRLRGALFSMIFQDPLTSLDPTVPVGEQIAEAILVHRRSRSKEQVYERVIELMDLTGIGNPRERYSLYPHQLSGGMRQRCVMAAALAGDPAILLADEPTTALDVTVQAQVLDLLRELRERLGTSVILVSHDLGVVARAADRVAVMYAGQIVEIGTAEEIYYDPRHPYTRALLRSLPSRTSRQKSLPTIPGMPPSLIQPPTGDAFARRNPYALAIDYVQTPPMFRITDTHAAATWLLDPRAAHILNSSQADHNAVPDSTVTRQSADRSTDSTGRSHDMDDPVMNSDGSSTDSIGRSHNSSHDIDDPVMDSNGSSTDSTGRSHNRSHDIDDPVMDSDGSSTDSAGRSHDMDDSSMDSDGRLSKVDKDILVDVRHLSRQFRLSRKSSFQAVRDVSFQIRRGEIFGLVGESGSGKSTIAKCIMGILPPSGGQILYDGIDLSDRTQVRAHKKRLQTERQMIFQDSASSLNQRMRIADILAEPMSIHKITPPRGSLREEAKFQLRHVGMDESCLDQYPSRLSGGQRQRVSIARALSMNPRLLVADEPVASLDVSIQAQIVNLFRHLQEEHEFSILFIAHDLAMVRYLCDRIGVMYQGRLVEMADTEELFDHPCHPYTQALLSSIPIPDPLEERSREPVDFDALNVYLEGEPVEIAPGHFVLGERRE